MRRLALSVAAAAGLALTASAAPAQAEPAEETPLIGVLVPEQVAVIQGKSKTVRAEVINAGKVTAKNVVLKFDKVDASLGLALPADCVDNACAVGTLRPGQRRTYSFTLKPTGAELTSTFDVSLGSAGGVEGYGSSVTVVRSTGGVDLEVDPIDDLQLGRGETGTVPLVVRNTGTKAVENVGVVLVAEEGLEALSKYRNCQTDEELEELGGVVCVFDQTFEPGASFSLPAETPLQVKLAVDAGGPYKYSAAVVAVGVSDNELGRLTAKSGPTLRMEEVTEEPADEDEDINGDDNVATFGVSVDKSVADTAAIGATFTGAVGDTRSVEVGVRNLGPTALVPPGLDWFPTVTVTLPTGVKLTQVDEACLPGDGTDFDLIKAGAIGGRTYTCLLVPRLGKDDSETFRFTGTITKGDHEAGTVVADGGVQDSSRTNNTAALTVKLTGGGAGAPGDDDGGQGGGLPITGAPAGWIAGGGALLLLAGAAALIMVRRRRIVTVTD